MAQKEQPLRETVRQYPKKERLSNKATALFNATFKAESKSVSAKKAFTAAKQAVEKLPKEERYKSDAEIEADEAAAEAETDENE